MYIFGPHKVIFIYKWVVFITYKLFYAPLKAAKIMTHIA